MNNGSGKKIFEAVAIAVLTKIGVSLVEKYFDRKRKKTEQQKIHNNKETKENDNEKPTYRKHIPLK